MKNTQLKNISKLKLFFSHMAVGSGRLFTETKRVAGDVETQFFVRCCQEVRCMEACVCARPLIFTEKWKDLNERSTQKEEN